MYCLTCGATIEDGTSYCPVCGAQVTATQKQNASVPETEVLFEETGRLDEDNFTPSRDNVIDYMPINNKQQEPLTQGFSQPVQQNFSNNSQVIDEKTFYNQFAAKGTKGWVNALIVICYVTGISSIGLIAMGNMLSIADMLVYLVFGILLTVQKRWYFPLVVTIYGGVFSLITIASSGSPVGIFAVVAGILSITKLKKINDAYKQYQVSGVLPQNQI